MKVEFHRHINELQEVGWSCKIDGSWISGHMHSLEYSKKSRKPPSIGPMDKFMSFVDYISTNDLRRNWVQQ